MSTRVDGATITVTVTACATLSAGTIHMTLTAREGPLPGIWQYNLNDGTDNRAGRGRIAAGGPGLARDRGRQRHPPRH